MLKRARLGKGKLRKGTRLVFTEELAYWRALDTPRYLLLYSVVVV